MVPPLNSASLVYHSKTTNPCLRLRLVLCELLKRYHSAGKKDSSEAIGWLEWAFWHNPR
jgi:hypothetical protein